MTSRAGNPSKNGTSSEPCRSDALGPTHDLVIIGGGPAGCATAIAARRLNLDVLLVAGAGHAPLPGTCAGWVSPAAARACQEWGVDLAACGVEFTGLRLRTWDLAKHVDVQGPGLAGWIVETGALRAALRATAQAAGAHVRTQTRVQHIAAVEGSVRADLSDGTAIAGKLMAIADGAASENVSRAQSAAVRPTASAGEACGVVLPAVRDPGRLDVILGASRALTLITVAQGARQTRVTLATHERGARPAELLAEFLRRARQAGLVPADEGREVFSGPCLAGLALEFESHVGKRCLLVGDAGGFVTAFSHEGLYPALRCGGLAADTAARALAAPVLQDELATFCAAWRAELAEYLRMPNTDLGLLLPMVFGNPQMSRRLAQAFLLGQGF